MTLEQPRTVQEAVEHLTHKLSQTEKINIADLEENELINLHFGLGQFIRNGYGLWNDNLHLLLDCQRIKWKDFANMPDIRMIHPDDASMVIIKALWIRLRDQ